MTQAGSCSFPYLLSEMRYCFKRWVYADECMRYKIVSGENTREEEMCRRRRCSIAATGKLNWHPLNWMVLNVRIYEITA